MAVPGLSCSFQGVGGTRENRIWRLILPTANRQIQIPVAYSVYTVGLIFHTETRELRICLLSRYAHSWLLEIAALEMHSQQVVMEQLARPHGATGRVVGTRRDGNDDDTRNFSVVQRWTLTCKSRQLHEVQLQIRTMQCRQK